MAWEPHEMAICTMAATQANIHALLRSTKARIACLCGFRAGSALRLSQHVPNVGADSILAGVPRMQLV